MLCHIIGGTGQWSYYVILVACIITSAELVDFSWLRLNFVLRRRCRHHTHALRDNSQNGIAAETSYQNTIQNSTLHQAVSHGSMVDSKERSASGSKGFFPQRPSHIRLLQTETAAKFSGPLTPESLRVAVRVWGKLPAGPEKTHHNPCWKDATWKKHKYHTSWYHIWQLSATTTWSRSDKFLSVRHWFIWLFQGSDQVWTSTSRRVQNTNPSLKSRLFTSSSYVLLHWKLRFETSRSSSDIWASSRSLRDTRKPCPIRKMRGENLDQHGLPNMLLLTWASQHVAGPPQSQCQAPQVVPEMLKGEFPWMTRWIVWLIPISMLIPYINSYQSCGTVVVVLIEKRL